MIANDRQLNLGTGFAVGSAVALKCMMDCWKSCNMGDEHGMGSCNRSGLIADAVNNTLSSRYDHLKVLPKTSSVVASSCVQSFWL